MRVHTVKSARKDYPQFGIKIGETYYWWKFRYGGKIMSKTYPKQSQLTRSSYLSQLYDLQDRLSNVNADTAEDLQSEVEDIKSDLESLKEETESSLENMPEHLQESSNSGSLLQERIDALDNAISELDGIDFDYDEPDRQDIIDELKDESSDEDYEPDESEIEERLEEKLREWIYEKISEVQDVSFE